MNPSNRRAQKLRMPAILLTLVAGLVLGVLLVNRQESPPLRNLGQHSTAELLRLVDREDTTLRRIHRWMTGQLPQRVRIHSAFLNPSHPDRLKVPALIALAGRTNESSVLVPALITRLELLAPTNHLAPHFAKAIEAHGAAASNATSWLEAAIAVLSANRVPPAGVRLNLGHAAVALARISPDHDATFVLLTNLSEQIAAPRTEDLARIGPSNLYEDWLARYAGFQMVLQGIVLLDGVPARERADYLEGLLDSPYRMVKLEAWNALRAVTPDSEIARHTALAWLNELRTGPASQPGLQDTRFLLLHQLLNLVEAHPKLMAELLPHLEDSIAGSPTSYWQVAGKLVKAGPPAHPAARMLAEHLAGARFLGPTGWRPADAPPGYSVPEELLDFIRAAGADTRQLQAVIQSGALDPTNRFRLDDAQLFSQLTGATDFERQLLEAALNEAPPNIRRLKLSRLIELQPDSVSVMKVATRYLSDAEPQMRRRSLMAIGAVGPEAAALLAQVEAMEISDPSPIVRWQAGRTADLVRGIVPGDPNEPAGKRADE